MGPVMLSAAGEAYFLVSFWKPVILLLPMVGWAWMVSAVFDKFAARFFLPRAGWNTFHMFMGLAALIVGFLMPVPGLGGFFAGLLAMIVILAIDIAVFVLIANKDERVPAEHRLRLDFSQWKAAREAKAAAKKQGKVTLVIKAPDKSTLPVPERDKPEFAVRVAAEALVTGAIENRAGSVELAPAPNGQYQTTHTIDGVRQPAAPMPGSEGAAIVDFWKAAAKLDLQDRRRKQQADVQVEQGASKIKLRLTTVGSQAGQKLAMLFNPEEQVRRKPEDLGLLEPQAAELKAMVNEQTGVVLISGMPHNGRTTIFYALIKMHDAYTNNVQTVELDVQDTIEGTKQNRWDAQQQDGPEFSTLVRSIIRRDPNVLGVAELPDANTAKEIAKADVERTRVYVGMRADGVVPALQTWVKAVGDPELAAKPLRGIVAHKLLRKVCINCRQPYQPAPDMLKKLGLPADKVKQLYKKGGQVLIKNKPEVCPVCQGTGYLSQDALFELTRLTDADREMIKTGNWNGLKAELRKRGVLTMWDAARRKLADGLTTVEEVMRVTAEAAPSNPGAPNGPAAATAPTAQAKPPAGQTAKP